MPAETPAAETHYADRQVKAVDELAASSPVFAGFAEAVLASDNEEAKKDLGDIAVMIRLLRSAT
jgi:hypothetical protein